MVNITSVQERGNQIVALLEDGTKVICYPTSGGLWIPKRQGPILVEPANVPIRNYVVTVPSVEGVQYRKNGVNVANGSTHNITEETTFTAVAKPGYVLAEGPWIWVFQPADPPDPENPDTSDFKWVFARSLRRPPYSGHSGIDWSGSTVGDTANIHAIGAGSIVQRYAYSGNTYGDSGGTNEPVWRGNCLVVDHGTIAGRRIWSLYAHMRDAPGLDVGDNVSAGQVIGRVGNTGYSTGAHLHFEVIYNRVRLRTGQGGYERTMDWMDANAEGTW